MTLRIGTDSSKFPGASDLGAIGMLRAASDIGLEGVFFRTAFELSPTLDPAELADVAAAASDLGLYLEVGVAKVNPFATPEAPGIRALGDGDYLLGMERIIRAVTAVGITELWTATANYQFRIPGLRACDRFRTDVDWVDQLRATSKVLDRLAPLLRDVGAHLNLETHEEITSFEVVRLVEEAGPDAFGITFDTANVLVRSEDPVAAARRVAPYTRMTHVRDAAMHATEHGIGRFLAPVGSGVIDWHALLGTLDATGRDISLSIEGVIGMSAEMTLFVDEPEWRASHADLAEEEFERVLELTRRYEERARRGDRPDLAALRAPIDDAGALDFIERSARELRLVLDQLATATTTDTTTQPTEMSIR